MLCVEATDCPWTARIDRAGTCLRWSKGCSWVDSTGVIINKVHTEELQKKTFPPNDFSYVLSEFTISGCSECRHRPQAGYACSYNLPFSSKQSCDPSCWPRRWSEKIDRLESSFWLNPGGISSELLESWTTEWWAGREQSWEGRRFPGGPPLKGAGEGTVTLLPVTQP